MSADTPIDPICQQDPISPAAYMQKVIRQHAGKCLCVAWQLFSPSPVVEPFCVGGAK